MKSVFIAAALLLVGLAISAQEKERVSFTYGDFRMGYSQTIFGTILEERFHEGNFSNSGGFIASVGAYRKFEKINYVQLGLRFQSMGAAPSSGDDGYEMFFNFWAASIGIKVFPFSKHTTKGLYASADYQFTTQFTQKYRNTELSIFEHQFAIGSGFNIGLGYDLPFGEYGILVGIEYGIARRQGEVSDIGDVQFENSNVAFMVGLRF
jgi:hypothetical protein